MRSGLSLLGLVLAAGVLVGGSCGPSACVQFDAQSIRARHDEARDRVDLLLVYRDLTTQPGGDPAKAVELLDTIRNNRTTFALVENFPISLEEADRETRSGPAAAALWSLLVRDVAITNGLLWRDERGRLCASQFLRVAHVTGILAAANAAIAESFRDEMGRALAVQPPGAQRVAPAAAPETLDDWLTPERLQRIVAAGEAGYRFLTLRGSAIVFSLPLAGDDAGQLRRAVLATIRRDLDKGSAEQRWWQLDVLARNRLAMDAVGDDLQIVLGDPAEAELHVEIPPRGELGNDLGAELAARGWAVAGPEGEAQARAAFAAIREQR